MSFRAVLLIVLLVFCAAPKISAAQKAVSSAPSMTPLHPEWQKIHKAGLILIGTLMTRASETSKPDKPLLLEIRSVQVLKGALTQNQTNNGIARARYFLPYSAKPEVLEKTLRSVQDLTDKRVLVFAESTNGLNGLEATIQVLSARDATILPAKLSESELVRAEIKNQAAIKAWFPTSPLSKNNNADKWERTVGNGIDRLVRDAKIDWAEIVPADDAKKRQQACVEVIEGWGPDSYPTLIRHLSDRRKLPGLPVGYNSPNNPNNPFESKYYLSPRNVAEVIDSVLTFSTGADLSPIDLRPGADEAQLAAVTQAWWVYLVYSHAATSTASDK